MGKESKDESERHHRRSKDKESGSGRHRQHEDDKERSKRKEKHRDGGSRRKHHDDDRDRKSSSKSKRSKNGNSSNVVDDDASENEELWVEKAGDEQPDSVANIPTRDSLSLTSHANPSSSRNPAPLPHPGATESQARERRDEWMLDDQPMIRQSENLTNGGTFSVSDATPTGIARPNQHDTMDDFTDGFGEGDVGTKGKFGGDTGDLFSSMGTERRRKDGPAEKLKKAAAEGPKMHAKEINKAIFAQDGSRLASSEQAIAGTPSQGSTSGGSRPPLPGSSGSSWRMMKLKRTYETAEEEKRPIEEVGIERFGSLEAFEAAKEERLVLDGKGTASRRPLDRSSTPQAGASSGADLDEFGRERRKEETPQPQTRYIFNEPGSANSSRPPSRAGSFRRPGSYGEDAGGPGSRSGTPVPSQQRTSSKPSTPIPSVFTPPPAVLRKPSQLQASTTAEDVTRDSAAAAQANDQLVSKPPMSPTSLNRMQAKILRMRLMGGNDAELKELEQTYETECQRSRQGDGGEGYFESQQAGGTQNTEVRVLPTLDGRGRLYDIGQGKEKDEAQLGPGNKRKRKEAKFETRDPKTGELLRINADDDTVTLEELIRQEKFGGGSMDQKNMDHELAARITTDAKFEDDLDYMDDSAERLARKKVKTEAQKKMFAINDYAKTRKALDSCQFCYQDTETTTVPPQAAIVALGTRAYLSLPITEPLVEGHTLIVPIQHHLTSLEADEDTWEEIKNFMKTLMQMHAQANKGVLFYETVVSLHGQRHTYIEAIPLPWEKFEEMPAYFREAILTSEAEWSQHQKLIDFSKRPGGFRRSMVSNLPYFMIQWDYKGEKGFGHVIEGPEQGTGEGDTYDFDEGAKGGGQFERYFAAEIIGNIMELEPRKWRKPRRMDKRQNEERIKAFKKHYDAYDWTKMLNQTSDA